MFKYLEFNIFEKYFHKMRKANKCYFFKPIIVKLIKFSILSINLSVYSFVYFPKNYVFINTIKKKIFSIY